MGRIKEFLNEAVSRTSCPGQSNQRHDIGGSVSVKGIVGLKDIKLDEAWKKQVSFPMDLYYRVAKAILTTHFQY